MLSFIPTGADSLAFVRFSSKIVDNHEAGRPRHFFRRIERTVHSSRQTTPGIWLERARNPEDSEARSFMLSFTIPYLMVLVARHGITDHHKKEDLIHDVCTTILSRLATFERTANGSYRAWVKKILVNRLNEIRRREKHRERKEVPFIEEPESPSDADLDRKEYLALAIGKALTRTETQCSTRDREIFLDVLANGMPPETVAAAENVSVTNVYKIVSRVRRLMREALGDFLEPEDLE